MGFIAPEGCFSPNMSFSAFIHLIFKKGIKVFEVGGINVESETKKIAR